MGRRKRTLLAKVLLHGNRTGVANERGALGLAVKLELKLSKCQK